jgi:hypothetical protein
VDRNSAYFHYWRIISLTLQMAHCYLCPVRNGPEGRLAHPEGGSSITTAERGYVQTQET